MLIEGKKALYLSVNVFSTKVLIGDTILTSPIGDWTTILRGDLSHMKVWPFGGQRYSAFHFSVILRPWVLVQPWESNLWPPALQSSTLLTELILLRLKHFRTSKKLWQIYTFICTIFGANRIKPALRKWKSGMGSQTNFYQKCGYYLDILICSFITWNVC